MFTGRLQITLFVRDVPESVEFYQRVLGFAFEGYWDPKAGRFVERWSVGGEAGATGQAELTAGPNRIVLRPAAGEVSSASAEYAIEVEDLDLFHRRAMASGNLTDPQPRFASNGVRRFSLTDCDGHTWHLFQR